MARKNLNFQIPVRLALVEGATTPNPGTSGITVWSTTANKLLVWDGARWGTPSLPTTPSMFRAYGVTGGSGHGSAATCVRRFGTVVTNTGSDMIYAGSVANGDSITVAVDGVYAVSFTGECSTAAEPIGISVNSPNLAINILNLPQNNILGIVSVPIGAYAVSVSCTIFMPVGSVIRIQTGGGTPSGPYNFFAMARVS